MNKSDLWDIVEEYLDTKLFRDANIPEVNRLLNEFIDRVADPEPEYEYGWAGDARATTFYDSREEAEEYMGDPKQFRRRKAGPWEEVK
jgi:hypothetical protein